MIPQAVKEYCLALRTHTSKGRPLTLIGEVNGANKVAKVVQVGLKIVRHCAKEGMLEISPEVLSGVKGGLKAIGAARDYMSVCDGFNKCTSSGENTQKAYKALTGANKDRVECWIKVAKGVGGIAILGMFVGGKPFLILHKHMGINVFGMVGTINTTYMVLTGISSGSKVTEKTLKIYQLHHKEGLSTEKYYEKLVPHSVKLVNKIGALARTTMYFGQWGSPGLNLTVHTISALTALLSAHIKSGADKKE